MHSPRLIAGREALARKYGEAEMSSVFRSMGPAHPHTPPLNVTLGKGSPNGAVFGKGPGPRPPVNPKPKLSGLGPPEQNKPP